MGQDEKGSPLWKTTERTRQEGLEQDLKNGQFIFEQVCDA